MSRLRRQGTIYGVFTKEIGGPYNEEVANLLVVDFYGSSRRFGKKFSAETRLGSLIDLVV
jgi:hypothetical protein